MDDPSASESDRHGAPGDEVQYEDEGDATLQAARDRFRAVESITISLRDRPGHALRVFVVGLEVVGVREIVVSPDAHFEPPGDEFRGLIAAVGMGLDYSRIAMMYCWKCGGTLGYGNCDHG
jgi:hypothetical protein